ncbi:MAG: hypothetical protein KC431_31080, partial [Myxococcales bacterium]|nr:hypothetical protein [Myxococcales bacterium]
MSAYRGPILAGLLLFSGTWLWALTEHRQNAERDRAEAKRHIEGLANAVAMVANGRSDADFAAALETSLHLGRPLHLLLVERDGRVVAHVGRLSVSAAVTDPAFGSAHDLMVTHAVLAEGRVRIDGGPIPRPLLWRWLAEDQAGLDFYIVSDSSPPPDVVARKYTRLAAMLVLSWIAIIGFAVAWARSIRSRDLGAALDVERRERARLGDLNLAAAGLAHETMNPLGLIHGFAQQLVNDPDISARGRDTAEQILEEADRAAARLSDFINFARHVEVEITAVDAAEVIG